MCGDQSRKQIGGTIAVLKSPAANSPDITLLFDTADSASITTATFRCITATRDRDAAMGKYQMLIQ